MNVIWKALFLFVSLLIDVCLTQEDASCYLPDNGELSRCVRLHHCDSFMAILRKSSGKPSTEEASFMNKHKCGDGRFVCCPDISVSDTPSRIDLPEVNYLNEVSNHRNLELINNKDCSKQPTFYAPGGSGIFPWMALLKYRSNVDLKFSCAGSLISSFYVLTAAHCINSDLIAVRFRENRAEISCDDDESCVSQMLEIPVDKAIKHDEYNMVRKINDIALIRLQLEVDLANDGIGTVCLPANRENQLDTISENSQKFMSMTGWIKTESTDSVVEVVVPLLKPSECALRFSPFNISYHDCQICGGGQGQSGVCQGNYGGPLQTYADVDGLINMVLFGVVSEKLGCVRPGDGNYIIYTNVAHYLTWILNNMY